MRNISEKTSVSMLALGIVGSLSMASAMGFGRFSYTPILPGMMADIPLSASQAGYIAAGNFVGYLTGAIFAAYSWGAGRERFVTLCGLLATSILLFITSFFTSVEMLTIIRFLSGVASAMVMVFASQIVIGHAVARSNEAAPAAHYGGVGVGIAASSLMVYLTSLYAGDAASWREEWFAGGVFAFVVFIYALFALPEKIRAVGGEIVEPPIHWHKPLFLTALSYAIYGFGYVITATFIVTMARMSGSGSFVEFIVWFVAGLATIVSLFAWTPIMRRYGLKKVYVAALVLQAIGVLGSVTLPVLAGVMVGGFALGATFMAITAYGLQIGRQFSAASPRRAFALMTAGFGVGQILGPLAAGWIAEYTGDFVMPTLIAVLALTISCLLMVPVLRDKSL